MNTATTASETAKAIQTALNAAMTKAGFGHLVGAFKVEGNREWAKCGDREALWLDSQCEAVAPRAKAFVNAWLVKHLVGAGVDVRRIKRPMVVACSYERIIRREWYWQAA